MELYIKDNGSILKIKQIFDKKIKGFDLKNFCRQIIPINGRKMIKKEIV